MQQSSDTLTRSDLLLYKEQASCNCLTNPLNLQPSTLTIPRLPHAPLLAPACRPAHSRLAAPQRPSAVPSSSHRTALMWLDPDPPPSPSCPCCPRQGPRSPNQTRQGILPRPPCRPPSSSASSCAVGAAAGVEEDGADLWGTVSEQSGSACCGRRPLESPLCPTSLALPFLIGGRGGGVHSGRQETPRSLPMPARKTSIKMCGWQVFRH